MAAYYWDYNGTAGTGTPITSDQTGTTTSDNYCTVTITDSTRTTTCGGFYVVSPPPRQIVVRHPAGWTDEQHAKYVQLVNDRTNTGWRVTMLMKGGDIAITDPNVEIRDMKDMVLLLKDRASATDREIIDDFFVENKPE